MRRYSLSRSKQFSTRCRALKRCWSQGIGSLRWRRGGIMGSVFCARKLSRRASWRAGAVGGQGLKVLAFQKRRRVGDVTHSLAALKPKTQRIAKRVTEQVHLGARPAAARAASAWAPKGFFARPGRACAPWPQSNPDNPARGLRRNAPSWPATPAATLRLRSSAAAGWQHTLLKRPKSAGRSRHGALPPAKTRSSPLP